MGEISIIKGNIFNSSAQTIVNTVNCVGVMGSIGKLWLYKGEPNKPWVLNFPTKTHWKLPSEYSYIELGLQKFVSAYKDRGITSIAFPLLGANNGGLDKSRVLSIMENYLSRCDIPIEIYQYDPTAKDDLFDAFKEKWNSIPSEDKKSAFGIRTIKQIEMIDQCLNSDEIKSLIGLIEYPGIGIVTMQRCYDFIMNY